MMAGQFPPFLETEIPDLPEQDCLFRVIPAPYEESVSYGKGTAHGPEAILAASAQLEGFDGISCPCRQGIFTQEPVFTLDDIATATANAIHNRQIPVVLGGEHTVTYPVLQGVTSVKPEIGVFQFDAHADLRDEYEGNRLSHACAMARVLELHLPLFQIGVRSMSVTEKDFRRSHQIPSIEARTLARQQEPFLDIPSGFPQQVYITFDIDALDPALMPATGTPEPGGLSWWQTMSLLEQIAASRTIIGFDVVELAPIATLHAPDFVAARLVYNIMGMAARQRQ